MKAQYSAVIMGVESEYGLSAVLAKYCATQGLHVYIAGRNTAALQKVSRQVLQNGGTASAIVIDAGKEYDMDHLFDVIHFEGTVLQFAVYHVNNTIPSSILANDSEVLTALWQQNCLGAMLFAKEVISCMQAHNKGSLFLTGMTTALDTQPTCMITTSLQAELKSFAQSLAKEVASTGIHVVHVSLDSQFKAQRITPSFPGYTPKNESENLSTLETIAETYWHIHQQTADLWVHEFELKPFKVCFQSKSTHPTL